MKRVGSFEEAVRQEADGLSQEAEVAGAQQKNPVNTAFKDVV
jgi:hypothetical protein